MSLDQHYSSGSHSPEREQTGRSAPNRTFKEAAAIAHDVFWFALLPVSFVFAPLIAFAVRILLPIETFSAAGLPPAAASLASDMYSGLLLFAVSGWLFLLAVWFYRTPDPGRNFIDYCRGGMVFALLVYVWALAPSLVSLLVAVFAKFFMKGSV